MPTYVAQSGWFDLAFAIIKQAIKQAHKNDDEARKWLQSEECAFYCKVCELPHHVIIQWTKGLFGPEATANILINLLDKQYQGISVIEVQPAEDDIMDADDFLIDVNRFSTPSGQTHTRAGVTTEGNTKVVRKL